MICGIRKEWDDDDESAAEATDDGIEGRITKRPTSTTRMKNLLQSLMQPGKAVSPSTGRRMSDESTERRWRLGGGGATLQTVSATSSPIPERWSRARRPTADGCYRQVVDTERIVGEKTKSASSVSSGRNNEPTDLIAAETTTAAAAAVASPSSPPSSSSSSSRRERIETTFSRIPRLASSSSTSDLLEGQSRLGCSRLSTSFSSSSSSSNGCRSASATTMNDMADSSIDLSNSNNNNHASSSSSRSRTTSLASSTGSLMLLIRPSRILPPGSIVTAKKQAAAAAAAQHRLGTAPSDLTNSVIGRHHSNSRSSSLNHHHHRSTASLPSPSPSPVPSTAAHGHQRPSVIKTTSSRSKLPVVCIKTKEERSLTTAHQPSKHPWNSGGGGSIRPSSVSSSLDQQVPVGLGPTADSSSMKKVAKSGHRCGRRHEHGTQRQRLHPSI